MGLTSRLIAVASARRFAAVSTLFIGFLAALVLYGPSSAISSNDWMVLATAGSSEWRETAGQGAWQDMQMNSRLPDGAEVRTGDSGTAIVAKGLDRIEIRPGTSLVVSARHSSKGALEIDQISGSATYTVEKRPAGTFSVHTPYVVAVVKGTKFDVDITGEETSVSVSEGRVGVSDRRSGESIDVTPGQRARSASKAAGIDVEVASNSGRPNPNAKPSSKANAKALENAATRGKSGAAPGNSADSSGGGNAAGNGGDNGGDNGSDNGGGAGGGNGGGNAGGNGGGNDKSRDK